MNDLYTTQRKHIVKFFILANTGLHTLQIRHIITKSVSTVLLRSTTIDSKLKFKDVNNIIKGAYNELYSLRTLPKFRL